MKENKYCDTFLTVFTVSIYLVENNCEQLIIKSRWDTVSGVAIQFFSKTSQGMDGLPCISTDTLMEECMHYSY